MADAYRGDYAACIADVRTLALFELLRQRLVREVPLAAPGAGNEFSTFVPSGAAWEVLTVRYALGTSAAVANRVSQLVARDAAATEVARFSAVVNQAASQSVTYTYTAGLGTSVTASIIQFALPSPPLTLAAGWELRSSTSALDVADAYSGVVLTVREWSVGQLFWLADLLGRELDHEAPTGPVAPQASQPIATGITRPPSAGQ